MEQPVLIPVELDSFSFSDDVADYATLGLEPRESTLQYLRDFARIFRPL